MDSLEQIAATINTWDGVKIAPHRFGGVEFTLGTQEIGHILENGALEIPFDYALRAQLVAEGKANPHPIYTQSGWISFQICTPAGIYRAVWLLKLSWQLNRIRQHRHSQTLTDSLRYDIQQHLNNLRLSEPIAVLVGNHLKT